MSADGEKVAEDALSTILARALPACLPVPPRLRRREVIETTYTIERRSDGLWHEHVSYYDAMTGVLIVDICTFPANEGTTTDG